MVVRAIAKGRTSTAHVRRFTRAEYERMAAQGILGPDERVELVEGEILVMAAQGSRHTTVVHLCSRALEAAFGPKNYARVQSPLAIDPDGEPEPDVAVVAGTPDDYLHAHPTTALIVVEVAETTLALDPRKAATYARAKVPEYWIANLVVSVLEVHRRPVRSARGEFCYSEIKRVKRTGTIQPLGTSRTKLKVSDLLR